MMKGYHTEFNLNVSEKPEAQGEDGILSANSPFRIILPIILVLGGVIVVVIGILLHRIILRLLRKRWHTVRRPGSHVSQRNLERRSSAGGINTVSGSYDDLPSYGQVMEAIQKEGRPPSYYEVRSGAVNLAFNAEENQLDGMYDIFERPLDNSYERRASDHSRPDADASSPAENSDESQGHRDILDTYNFSAYNQRNVTDSATAIGTSFYRSPVTPVEQSTTIIIHDIDEIANSISVPSLLSSRETSNHSISKAIMTSFKKCQGSYRSNTHGRDDECTSFSLTGQTCSPKPSQTTRHASIPAVGVIESTPV